MITFESGMDIRCRHVSVPTVARLRIYSDFGATEEYRFCVIGTQYGYLHTSGGDVRTWQTYSGARRAIRNYHPL